MEFCDAINKAESKWNTGGRNAIFNIVKQD